MVSFIKLVLIDTELWPSQALFNNKKNNINNKDVDYGRNRLN
jgi:hypothetical protein